MIHLDTSFLAKALWPKSAEHARMTGWWSSPTEQVDICTIVWAEFLCGPLSGADEQIARSLFPVPVSFLPADADLAARLFNHTGRRSRSLADCMIAAIAIRCQAHLATLNQADFQRFVPYGLLLA